MVTIGLKTITNTLNKARKQILLERIAESIEELHEKYGASILFACQLEHQDGTVMQCGATVGSSFDIAETLFGMIKEDGRIKDILRLAIEASNKLNDK